MEPINSHVPPSFEQQGEYIIVCGREEFGKIPIVSSLWKTTFGKIEALELGDKIIVVNKKKFEAWKKAHNLRGIIYPDSSQLRLLLSEIRLNWLLEQSDPISTLFECPLSTRNDITGYIFRNYLVDYACLKDPSSGVPMTGKEKIRASLANLIKDFGREKYDKFFSHFEWTSEVSDIDILKLYPSADVPRYPYPQLVINLGFIEKESKSNMQMDNLIFRVPLCIQDKTKAGLFYYSFVHIIGNEALQVHGAAILNEKPNPTALFATMIANEMSAKPGQKSPLEQRLDPELRRTKKGQAKPEKQTNYKPQNMLNGFEDDWTFPRPLEGQPEYNELVSRAHHIINEIKNEITIKHLNPRVYYMEREIASKLLGFQAHENFTASAIKKAYKKISLELHPDKRGDAEEAKKLFQLYKEAYECLIT